MADLSVVRLIPAVVVASGGSLAVNATGSLLSARWPGSGYIPAAGDAVLVHVVDGVAVVVGPTVAAPRPLTGTVAGAPSAGMVPLTVAGGTVSARYTGAAPGVGDVVRLDWQATTPWVWPGVVASTSVVVEDPVAPLPPPSEVSGTLDVVALDSATWNVAYGAWSTTHARSVVQGTWSGQEYRGVFFYGVAPQQVAGRTVAAARLRLGARLHIGAYSAALALQVWVHTSPTRPGSDVTRVLGPHVITLTPDAPAGWYDLPAAMGQHLADSGGGLAVATGVYGGVQGVQLDPASGQIALDWI